jgi:membrane associated rhomboid family serine protease
MGLESRNYYRDGSYTDSLSGWGIDFTPVVKRLILANVAVFLLQIFFTRPVTPQLPEGFEKGLENSPAVKDAPEGEKREEALRKAREAMEEMMERMPGIRASVVQDWLQLDPKKTVEGGQLWRLLTCAFCHDRLAIWHILFNMLLLYWFGTRLERMYGGREFLLFYLAAAVCGSLAYVGLAYYTGSNTPAIGASGAVMGVMMLYVIFYPNETILLFWFIPTPLWIVLSLYVLYDLHPVLLALAGDKMFTGVAHAGHLGGLAFGFLYWKFNLRLETLFGRKVRRWPRREPRPLPAREILPFREPDPLSERVDEVLQKISEQGKESLTDEERDVLIRASEKFRGKR